MSANQSITSMEKWGIPHGGQSSPKIALLERLVWVRYQSHWWPALLYHSYTELQHHLYDQLDMVLKAQFAMAIMRHLQEKRQVKVARLLGRKILEVIEVQEDCYCEFYWQLPSVLPKACDIARYSDINLFFDFHRAMDQVEEVIKEVANEHDFALMPTMEHKSWIERARSVAAEAHKPAVDDELSSAMPGPVDLSAHRRQRQQNTAGTAAGAVGRIAAASAAMHGWQSSSETEATIPVHRSSTNGVPTVYSGREASAFAPVGKFAASEGAVDKETPSSRVDRVEKARTRPRKYEDASSVKSMPPRPSGKPNFRDSLFGTSASSRAQANKPSLGKSAAVTAIANKAVSPDASKPAEKPSSSKAVAAAAAGVAIGAVAAAAVASKSGRETESRQKNVPGTSSVSPKNDDAGKAEAATTAAATEPAPVVTVASKGRSQKDVPGKSEDKSKGSQSEAPKDDVLKSKDAMSEAVEDGADKKIPAMAETKKKTSAPENKKESKGKSRSKSKKESVKKSSSKGEKSAQAAGSSKTKSKKAGSKKAAVVAATAVVAVGAAAAATNRPEDKVKKQPVEPPAKKADTDVKATDKPRDEIQSQTSRRSEQTPRVANTADIKADPAPSEVKADPAPGQDNEQVSPTKQGTNPSTVAVAATTVAAVGAAEKTVGARETSTEQERSEDTVARYEAMAKAKTKRVSEIRQAEGRDETSPVEILPGLEGDDIMPGLSARARSARKTWKNVWAQMTDSIDESRDTELPHDKSLMTSSSVESKSDSLSKTAMEAELVTDVGAKAAVMKNDAPETTRVKLPSEDEPKPKLSFWQQLTTCGMHTE